MDENKFIEAITPYLAYKPDSANYDLFVSFKDILFNDGGDDDFAHLDSSEMAFHFSKLVTLNDIEKYDNGVSPLDIYLEIKPIILNFM